jgi:hypothetical protein
MNNRTLGGWAILTLLLLYYVAFTLSEGYSIEWYGWLGAALYGVATWLLLKEQPTTPKHTRA